MKTRYNRNLANQSVVRDCVFADRPSCYRDSVQPDKNYNVSNNKQRAPARKRSKHSHADRHIRHGHGKWILANRSRICWLRHEKEIDSELSLIEFDEDHVGCNGSAAILTCTIAYTMARETALISKISSVLFFHELIHLFPRNELRTNRKPFFFCCSPKTCPRTRKTTRTSRTMSASICLFVSICCMKIESRHNSALDQGPF